jgi:hypothetical protein
MIKKLISTISMLSLLLVSVFLQTGCGNDRSNDNATEMAGAKMTDAEMISRGKYLVTLGGCIDCHSPKIMTPRGPVEDTTRSLSGHPDDSKLPEIDVKMVQPGMWYLASADLTAWVGPWGISYTANLTPDEPTGIGTWTDEVFIKALRTGMHMGVGRPILPPMPWEYIGKSTDDDLRAIFWYLKSLPPIRNKVPDPTPPDQIASRK